MSARSVAQSLSISDQLWMIRKELQEAKAATDAANTERAKWETRFLWLVGIVVAILGIIISVLLVRG